MSFKGGLGGLLMSPWWEGPRLFPESSYQTFVFQFLRLFLMCRSFIVKAVALGARLLNENIRLRGFALKTKVLFLLCFSCVVNAQELHVKADQILFYDRNVDTCIQVGLYMRITGVESPLRWEQFLIKADFSLNDGFQVFFNPIIQGSGFIGANFGSEPGLADPAVALDESICPEGDAQNRLTLTLGGETVPFMPHFNPIMGGGGGFPTKEIDNIDRTFSVGRTSAQEFFEMENNVWYLFAIFEVPVNKDAACFSSFDIDFSARLGSNLVNHQVGGSITATHYQNGGIYVYPSTYIEFLDHGIPYWDQEHAPGDLNQNNRVDILDLVLLQGSCPLQ